jgi:Tol biopolymer transport system component
MARSATSRIRMIAVGMLLAGMLVAALVSEGVKPAEAAFPGNNGLIAFQSNRITNDNLTGDSEIYTIDPADASGDVTQLTFNTAADYDPNWSSDGQKIAFVSERDTNAEIYTMDANGDNQTNISNNAAHDGEPIFSPDGTQIAFQTSRDGNNEIYVMNSDGSNPIRLTNNPALDSAPDWQPL